MLLFETKQDSFIWDPIYNMILFLFDSPSPPHFFFPNLKKSQVLETIMCIIDHCIPCHFKSVISLLPCSFVLNCLFGHLPPFLRQYCLWTDRLINCVKVVFSKAKKIDEIFTVDFTLTT